MSYIIHSAKGTSWGKHKYIKKIGNRYIYKEKLSKDDLKGLTDDVMSGKLGTGAELQKNLGSYYTQVMQSVNGKFKKPGSGGKGSKSSSKSKSDKGSSSSGSSKKVSEDNKVNQKPKTQTTEEEAPKSLAEVIKRNIKKSIPVGDKDSVYATKNEDGTTTVTIDYADGDTQTVTLDKNYEVIKKGEKVKKTLTHKEFRGNGYLIHSLM